MKYIIYLILIILLLALNVGFLSYIKIYGAAANLLLLLVILSALHKDIDNFIFIAAVSGIVLDVYTGVFFGSFALAFLFAALLIRLIVERIVVHELDWKYVFLVAMAAIVFTDLFVWQYNLAAWRFSLSDFAFSFSTIKRHILPELFYNALLLYPVYILVHLAMLGVLEFSRNRKLK